jgi:D-beta-D-heptose 7-phosphate kinase / D-beta-D-heptose 1-phosphate adenosyltransferase
MTRSGEPMVTDGRMVIPREKLAATAAAWRAAGQSIVFTNGVFDLLHPGHLALLQASAIEGDVLLVAINDDASVRRLKGESRPIYPAAERAEVLLGIRWVDAVTVFPEATPLEVIELVCPDVLVKGAEYGAGEIVGEEFVVGHGGRVVRYAMQPGQSTSSIVTRIRGRG